MRNREITVCGIKFYYDSFHKTYSDYMSNGKENWRNFTFTYKNAVIMESFIPNLPVNTYMYELDVHFDWELYYNSNLIKPLIITLSLRDDRKFIFYKYLK